VWRRNPLLGFESMSPWSIYWTVVVSTVTFTSNGCSKTWQEYALPCWAFFFWFCKPNLWCNKSWNEFHNKFETVSCSVFYLSISLFVARQSARERQQGSQPYAPAACPLPPGRFLVLISDGGWVDSSWKD
jgi:hypothetical protein